MREQFQESGRSVQRSITLLPIRLPRHLTNAMCPVSQADMFFMIRAVLLSEVATCRCCAKKSGGAEHGATRRSGVPTRGQDPCHGRKTSVFTSFASCYYGPIDE